MESRVIEDYCKAIDKLDRGEGVSVNEIAKELSLAKPTVSLTLKKLGKEGYVVMERYGKAKLSDKGRRIAQRLKFKHRVIETFFWKALGVDKDKVHEIACNIEHFIPMEVVKRMYEAIGKPKKDCHGSEIVEV